MSYAPRISSQEEEKNTRSNNDDKRVKELIKRGYTMPSLFTCSCIEITACRRTGAAGISIKTLLNGRIMYSEAISKIKGRKREEKKLKNSNKMHQIVKS